MIHSARVPATSSLMSNPRLALICLRSLHHFEVMACCVVLLGGCISRRERTASHSDSETSSLSTATTSFDSTRSDSLASASQTASAPSSETTGETTAKTGETTADYSSESTMGTTSPSETAMDITVEPTGASTSETNSGSVSDTESSSAANPGQSSCADPIPLQCGDRLNHSTFVNGQTDQMYGYGCSARLESGRETIYSLTTADRCDVEVRLTRLEVDLDLFSVEQCGVLSTGECSSTPLDLQEGEQIGFSTLAGVSRFVVVDGYAGAAGSYAIEVDCTCGD